MEPQIACITLFFKHHKIMIRINGFFQVAQEALADVSKNLCAIAEAGRQAEGCVAFDVFASLTRPDVVMTCETWKDEEARHAFKESDAFKAHCKDVCANTQKKIEQFDFPQR